MREKRSWSRGSHYLSPEERAMKRSFLQNRGRRVRKGWVTREKGWHHSLPGGGVVTTHGIFSTEGGKGKKHPGERTRIFDKGRILQLLEISEPKFSFFKKNQIV